ncbi:MAG: SAM-dependent methyltransferase [Phenylobacterium sp.]|uniref:small ribosomal subunit Rsm22 family protein n=1 Tax=Phenylobacterium sp. TaxID=1871053 RepID=UPI001A603011|nr:small ribosomal subunit Rsm22 family protein [Phenylobacterium sp.]MBL8771909.1 SAM-dependent methyltransferase [Phenylobacterium sp.]
MGGDLPPALKAAIARELEGRPRRDLGARRAAATAAYRAGGTSAAAIRGADDALAYALARLPATYAAAAAVFAEARRVAPGFRPASLLDAGSGPGGGSWAAREAWPSLRAIAWVDASAPFLALAGRLASGAFEPDARRGDLASADLPRADLVLASYALAEIPPVGQAGVVGRLWNATDGVLALVEPGTPAGYARLLEARGLLIAGGATILAPCPHADACPLTAPDWCHFSVRLARSRDHRLAKDASAPFEDEKFAYVLAARPGVAAAPARARVLARPHAGKPGIDLKLCTPAGLERRHVARRDKAAHAVARRLGWGDAWPDAEDAPAPAPR